MIKATKPTSPLFTSELDTFSFSIGGDSATVTITCAGEELLSETYYPVSGNITIYDLGTLIADAEEPKIVFAVICGRFWSFPVVFSVIPDMIPKNFLFDSF